LKVIKSVVLLHLRILVIVVLLLNLVAFKLNNIPLRPVTLRRFFHWVVLNLYY